MRKIIVLVGIFTILGIGGFIGKAIDVNATSKVELEDIVMKQQADIESLKSQLSDTTKRLEALESKQSNTDQFDTRLTHLENSIGAWNTNKTVKQLIDDTNNTLSNRILLLEKINQVDDASIQANVNSLPQLISNFIGNRINYDSYQCYPSTCTSPIEKDSLEFDPASIQIGSYYYNILDYVSEEKMKEIVLNAYNEKKSDKVIYKNLKVYIKQPFGQPPVLLEIPLQ